VESGIEEIDEDGTVEVGEASLEPVISSTASIAAIKSEDKKLPADTHLVGESVVSPVESGPTTKAIVSIPDTPAQTISSTKPKGDRWAISAPDVDLTGDWEVMVTDEFKQAYDKYLADLGQPALVRSVAVSIIAMTSEETKQTDNGKSLLIRGKNVRGVWDRTLEASGADIGVDDFETLRVPVMTADSEKVEAESWWEDEGRVHVSWLRGVTKYGGGSFESRRYLEDDGTTYVCETIFHQNDPRKDTANITWRFRRQAKVESEKTQ
jgi:hypothetical protein